MESELFDATSKEGRLLYVAICILESSGPEQLKGKEASEIINILEESAARLENFKM